MRLIIEHTHSAPDQLFLVVVLAAVVLVLVALSKKD